jgi:hypothetical protein
MRKRSRPKTLRTKILGTYTEGRSRHDLVVVRCLDCFVTHLFKRGRVSSKKKCRILIDLPSGTQLGRRGALRSRWTDCMSEASFWPSLKWHRSGGYPKGKLRGILLLVLFWQEKRVRHGLRARPRSCTYRYEQKKEPLRLLFLFKIFRRPGYSS